MHRCLGYEMCFLLPLFMAFNRFGGQAKVKCVLFQALRLGVYALNVNSSVEILLRVH
jgi:hypothetical protein